MVADGTIQPGERVLTYLTGHLLKDMDATVDYYLATDDEARGMIAIDPTPESLDCALADLV